MEPKYETILERRGVKPTSNRLLVLRAMFKVSRPVSLSELETELDTVDKSSIFRVLTLFVSHHVVHAIEDGSGTMKYEVCTGEDRCSLSDMHTHFYCESCHRTFHRFARRIYHEFGKLHGKRNMPAMCGASCRQMRH